MEIAVDGEAVFAHTGGRPFDPGRPVLVLLHGAGMDHTAWFMQTRYFAHHGFSVLAVDLPGHGRSGGRALGSVAALADWTAALLDVVGAEKAVLAGHSLGALAALETAARHPGRVRAVALLGVAAVMPVHPDLLAAAGADDHLAFDLVNDWAHGRGAHVGRHKTPGLWMMGGCVRLLERSRPGALHADLRACDDYKTAPEAAAGIRCPALLLLGDGDQMAAPKAARLLAERIANCRTVVLADCGHMMMTEQPDATIDALRDFLDEAL
jgi:pimeloyl-ACP methyl ester carboxylesterase